MTTTDPSQLEDQLFLNPANSRVYTCRFYSPNRKTVLLTLYPDFPPDFDPAPIEATPQTLIKKGWKILADYKATPLADFMRYECPAVRQDKDYARKDI